MISDCNAARQIWENNLKESEKILSKCKFAKSDDKQPAQEPVAWYGIGDMHVWKCNLKEDKDATLGVTNKPMANNENWKPLYTHPAPSSYQSNGKLSYSEELAYQTGFEAGREFERSCDD